jgi:intron-binding protein aquarius
MTCTHAAIMRDYLVEQGFKYDSLIMEEAAQILEIETFIPMCLQKMEGASSSSSDSKEHRLKRIVLLGDHYQLPPIIQNQSLQRICHFHQSMFTRLLRLGYPSLSLTHQGRSRKELVSLFNWRYSHSLTHLPSIETLPEYSLANPGFYYPFQLIDVPYYQQKGESLLNPSQHSSFQNLGEAEYLVAVFQYMCLLGYPSEKISILTTYQAQKQLIREILRKRCLYSNDPNKKNIFGKPKHITTIDKFQGQQNDYILVSLVRTDHIGYLKDIHRLIVFLSRARFGLYVFGHHSLFEKCPTWFPILSRFDHHPNRLTLVAGESFQNKTRVQSQTNHQEAAQKDNILEIDGVSTMGILVYQMTQQAQAAQKK